MKKNTVALIISLLSFCLAGIIGFQIFWFLNTYTIKEEQFDRSVFSAMNNMIEKLETYETLSAMDSCRSICGNFKSDNSEEEESDKLEFSFKKFFPDSLMESFEICANIEDSLDQATDNQHNENFQMSFTSENDSTKVQIRNHSFKVIVNSKKDFGKDKTGMLILT